MPTIAPALFHCGLFGVTEDHREGVLSLDEKFMKNRESTFYVRAGGDSMLPEIKHGDILVVDRSLKIFNGAIGAFFYNGQAICKQYLKTGKRVRLVSFNKKYPEFFLQEDDVLEIFGVVTGIAREFYQ